ncbi:MAG: tRNA epoxyqueuosine(34) reductase QueG [Candidatus Dormibacteria bacterium]
MIARALDAGWAAAGIAAVKPLPVARDRALAAIAEGRMAGMGWMSPERIRSASDLGARYPWARSILALAWPYRPAGTLAPLEPGAVVAGADAEPGKPRGRIAAYACLTDRAGRPEDYHDLMGREVDALVAGLRERVPGLRAKRFIDHGWAMDRPLAESAGIGFAGKNTTLLTAAAGSYVLLAEVLLSLDLEPSAPSRRDCGTCRACLPACPTGALVAPGVLDARRCISYLTIEHEGSIPEELRPQMGTWVFGCDLCQEACPINQRLAPEGMAQGSGRTATGPVPFPDLLECLQLREEEFAARFRSTPVLRSGRARLARNAAIALGNAGDRAALPALEVAAAGDPDAVVRESAQWAMARLAR